MGSRDLNAYDHLFQAAGEEYGIDPALLKAHSFVESGINVGTRASNQGAVGIMQMLPDTARGLGVKDPYDPEQAIRGAAKYIAEGFDKTGTAQGAVQYYHGGPDQRIWGPKTRAYLDKVAGAYDRFSREGLTPKQQAAETRAGGSAQVASMSPEDLVSLYGGGEAKPASSGGGEAPASGALAIRVKSGGGKADGLSPEDLVKLYGAGDETAQADAKPAVVPGDEAAAVGRGIINGVPIIGPYLTTATDLGVAGIRSLQSGKPFKEEYRTAKEFGLATADANPMSTTGGQTLGAVVGTGGLLAGAGALPVVGETLAAGGNMLMGVRGTQATEGALAAARAAQATGGTAETAAALSGAKNTNMLAKMAMGGGGGGAIGAADAGVRGEDMQRGALMGGAFGGGAPVVGRVLGAALGPTANRLTEAAQNMFGGQTRANNALLAAVEAGGHDTAALRAELARNPNLSLADLNPSLRQQIVGLGADGPQAGAVRQWRETRMADRPGQVRDGFDTTIGAAVDPVAYRQQLMDTARTNADRAFTPILENAQPVDLHGLPEASINHIQRAWDRVLASFPDPTQVRFSQPQQMHLVQQQLRREADAMASSAYGTERLAAGDVRNVRQQLIGRIDDATGGRFRPAQRQFRDDMDIGEAFDNGMGALARVRKGAAGLEDRPEALARDWRTMAPAERDAYRHGMRTAIDTEMQNARNAAAAGEAITLPDFNRQKLAIVYGDREAGRLIRAVEDSRRMSETNTAILGGSNTADKLAARDSVKVRGQSAPMAGLEMPAIVSAGLGPVAGGIAGTAKAGNYVAGVAGRRSDIARNRLMANDLMQSGPEGAAVLNRLDQFLAQRAQRRVGAGSAIEANAPLALTIRAGARPANMLLGQ